MTVCTRKPLGVDRLHDPCEQCGHRMRDHADIEFSVEGGYCMMCTIADLREHLL